MKMKHLLLLPFVGVAGASFAQSSVTLFGIVDATIAYGRGSIAHRTQMLRGGLNSNRLGFRGVEDLGGGLSAQFWLESGMNVDDGTGQSSNTNNQVSGATPAGGLTFNRRSTVSLAGNWGEVRLGRDYVPQYWNQIVGDPFGNVGVGASVNYIANISGVTNTRASNMISYFSPKGLGGLAVQASHYRGENPSNVANADDGNGSGIRVVYEAGPLVVGAAWGRTEYATGDATQTNFAAAYDFRVVKVMATLNRDKTGDVKARGGVVGVSVPVGPGEFKASYSQYRLDSAADPEAKQFAVGYVHNLSKRTALYATYATLRNSGGSSRSLNGGITAPNENASGFDLGVRHAF